MTFSGRMDNCGISIHIPLLGLLSSKKRTINPCNNSEIKGIALKKRKKKTNSKGYCMVPFT
jgi:hypothetical protein